MTATAQWRCGCWRKWVAGRQCFLSKGFTWHSRVLPWSSLPSAPVAPLRSSAPLGGGAALPAGAPERLGAPAWRSLLPPPGAVWSSREPERPDFSAVPWSGHSSLLRVESVAPSSTGSNSSHRRVMYIVEFCLNTYRDNRCFGIRMNLRRIC